MAIIKPVPTDFGIDAEYHRIAGFQIYYTEECLDVTLHTYVGEDARRTGKQPLGSIASLRLTFAELGGPEVTRAKIYKALALRPEWAGATEG